MWTASDEATYLMIGRDLEAVLQANGLTIHQVLTSVDATDLDTVSDPGALSGTRDAVLIMMASAALIAAATPLIVNAFKAMTQRPVVVKELELVPMLDGNGQPVKGTSGEPVLGWRERYVLLEPKQQPSPTASVIGYGLEIKLG